MPQRAKLASKDSSAAAAKQELGSPFPTRTERKPFFTGYPLSLKEMPYFSFLTITIVVFNVAHTPS
ncbi:MAG: hypothetical protein PHH38_03230 [Candidatus Cloacimonetes bacterium]|nr:hypothetical protein [Candidatus Cloacimonadota bacterium]